MAGFLFFLKWYYVGCRCLGDQCSFMIGHFLGVALASGRVKVMTPGVEKVRPFSISGTPGYFPRAVFPFIRTFVPFIAGMGGMLAQLRHI